MIIKTVVLLRKRRFDKFLRGIADSYCPKYINKKIKCRLEEGQLHKVRTEKCLECIKEYFGYEN